MSPALYRFGTPVTENVFRGVEGWIVFSGENVTDNFAADIRQSEIATGIAVSEFLMIKAQEVQHRGMEIMDVNRVFNGSKSELIGRTINMAALNATSG